MLANPGIWPHLCKHEEIPINYWAYPSLSFQLRSPNRYRCSYFSLSSYFDPFVWLITHLSCRLHLLHCSGVGEQKKLLTRGAKIIHVHQRVPRSSGGPEIWALSPKANWPSGPRATRWWEVTARSLGPALEYGDWEEYRARGIGALAYTSLTFIQKTSWRLGWEGSPMALTNASYRKLGNKP